MNDKSEICSTHSVFTTTNPDTDLWARGSHTGTRGEMYYIFPAVSRLELWLHVFLALFYPQVIPNRPSLKGSTKPLLYLIGN